MYTLKNYKEVLDLCLMANPEGFSGNDDSTELYNNDIGEN
jgi:hypothetical protein